MHHTQLGGIFTDTIGVRTVVGALVYDREHHHAMLKLDMRKLLLVCENESAAVVHGCCLPFPGVPAPPYLSGDIQVGRKNRVKIGFCFTNSDERGPAYQFVFDKETIAARFASVWAHIHVPSEKELLNAPPATT